MQPKRTRKTSYSGLRVSVVALIGLSLILLSIHAKSSPELHNYELAIEALREIGFALIVSVAIWITFEYFSASERETEWRHRIEEITANVFYAVLQKKLPQSLVETANELILDQVFIRNNMTVVYSLDIKRVTLQS